MSEIIVADDDAVLIEDGGHDPREFRSRWQSHVDDLERLRANLNDEQVEVLEDVTDQLELLVTEAATNLAAEQENAHARRTLQQLKIAEQEDRS